MNECLIRQKSELSSVLWRAKLKPMTHLKVSVKSYLRLRKKLSQEKLRKCLAKVLHDTRASWTTKVPG